MKPEFVRGNVRAHCPDCGGAVTTFEYKEAAANEYGTVVIGGRHEFEGQGYTNVIYKLLRCAACGRGGIAKLHCDDHYYDGVLEDFYPISIDNAPLPGEVPEDIEKEFREAERCAAFGARRAASALFRSTLEKTLKDNGYTDGGLKQKVENAAEDGVITESRRKLADDNVRVLGNDVLHDEWREVIDDEIESTHRYTQRILEDFYDDRDSVEAILKDKGRLSTE